MSLRVPSNSDHSLLHERSAVSLKAALAQLTKEFVVLLTHEKPPKPSFSLKSSVECLGLAASW